MFECFQCITIRSEISGLVISQYARQIGCMRYLISLSLLLLGGILCLAFDYSSHFFRPQVSQDCSDFSIVGGNASLIQGFEDGTYNGCQRLDIHLGLSNYGFYHTNTVRDDQKLVDHYRGLDDS